MLMLLAAECYISEACSVFCNKPGKCFACWYFFWANIFCLLWYEANLFLYSALNSEALLCRFQLCICVFLCFFHSYFLPIHPAFLLQIYPSFTPLIYHFSPLILPTFCPSFLPKLIWQHANDKHCPLDRKTKLYCSPDVILPKKNTAFLVLKYCCTAWCLYLNSFELFFLLCSPSLKNKQQQNMRLLIDSICGRHCFNYTF